MVCYPTHAQHPECNSRVVSTPGSTWFLNKTCRSEQAAETELQDCQLDQGSFSICCQVFHPAVYSSSTTTQVGVLANCTSSLYSCCHFLILKASISAYLSYFV